MNYEYLILMVTAASIGLFHTIIGPDHYLSFIVIGKARNWSLKKTLRWTFFCGIGHVFGSIVLGLIGVTTGILIHKIEFFESFRGSIAGWLFILFGFFYMIWGAWKIYKNKPHTHFHSHPDGEIHSHTHVHHDVHEHKHQVGITPWVLFTIFVFGPCEPLIPLLMYPAAQFSIWGVGLIALVFSFFTISTMMIIVFIATKGIHLLPMQKIEKFTHVLAGAIIFFSGLAIELFGL